MKTKTVRIDFQIDRRLAASLLLNHNRHTSTSGLENLHYTAASARETIRDALYDHGHAGR